MRLTKLINELKQRNVFRVATLYAVTAWVIIEFVGLVFPMFGIPLWTQRLIVIVALTGFPVALILSWGTRDQLHFGKTLCKEKEPL